MFFYKLFSRVSTTICRTSLLSYSTTTQHFSNHFLPHSPNNLIPVQANLLCPSLNSSISRFGFSSSASTKTDERKKGNHVHNGDSPNDDQSKTSEEVKETDQAGQVKPEEGSNSDSQSQTVKRRRSTIKRTAFSDSDSDSESELELFSRDDLIKRVAEKEKLLEFKQKEIQKMQEKVLRAYADMENVMDRTRRESENSKKFAIQNFAKSLLDVADNLGRASSVVKESFSKFDTSVDSSEATKLLKTLLEGVEMTEKQLLEVLKKFGVEKFDPTNEPFDPHRHNAVFQIPDDSKPQGTVAAVLKAGYLLHDRVIRPAEVGVTQAKEDNSPAE